MIPAYANLPIIIVSIITFIVLYIDYRRVTKENHEWYRLYIIGKADIETIEGMSIVKAVRDGESSETILQQLKQVHEDNSEAVKRLYGEWYNDLKKFL